MILLAIQYVHTFSSIVFSLPLLFGVSSPLDSLYKIVLWSLLAYILLDLPFLSTTSFSLIPMCSETIHTMIYLSWFWSSAMMSYI